MAAEPELQKLKAEEFETWRPVVSVLAQVAAHLMSDNASIKAIAPYLRNGLIRSGANRHAFEGESARGVVEIERERWGKSGDVDLRTLYDFWRSGTLAVRHRGDLLTYFDVRFDPAGVDAMMAAIAPSQDSQPRVAAVERPQATEDERSQVMPEDDKRDTISVADLAKWFVLFTATYPDWTVEDAIKSAVGMFPGHKVPRSMVRKQVGPRPRGRPKKK